jgi:hypothetical protein
MQALVKKSDPSKHTARPFIWLRAGLAFLVLTTAVVGIWTLFAPESFFTTFPAPGHPWVALLPPYNEHLVRDVGALNLSFTLLFTWATISLERRLIQIILLAWLVYAIPHFTYHLNHLMHFSLFDQVEQIVSLGIVILLPLVLLILSNKVQKQR